MAYTQKFQSLADTAMSQVQGVLPEHIDGLLATGAIALDIRDKEEHDADHIAGSLHVSRGKLEMNIEGVIPALDTVILCYCNAHNRGALSAATLSSMGYANARYIAGGLRAYRTSALKIAGGGKNTYKYKLAGWGPAVKEACIAFGDLTDVECC